VQSTVGDTGLELSSKASENTGDCSSLRVPQRVTGDRSTPAGDLPDVDLQVIIQAWPTLAPDCRAKLVAIARAGR